MVIRMPRTRSSGPKSNVSRRVVSTGSMMNKVTSIAMNSPNRLSRARFSMFNLSVLCQGCQWQQLMVLRFICDSLTRIAGTVYVQVAQQRLLLA